MNVFDNISNNEIIIIKNDGPNAITSKISEELIFSPFCCTSILSLFFSLEFFNAFRDKQKFLKFNLFLSGKIWCITLKTFHLIFSKYVPFVFYNAIDTNILILFDSLFTSEPRRRSKIFLLLGLSSFHFSSKENRYLY